MKKLFTTALLLFFTASLMTSCAQEPVTVAYRLPKDRQLHYTLTMTSPIVNLVQKVTFTGGDTNGDSLTVHALITQSEFDDPDMNYGNTYVDQPFYFVMSENGTVLQQLTYTETEDDAARQFNQKLFFPYLPEEAVNAGATWTREEEAFDMVFDRVSTTYTLKVVDTDKLTIHCAQTLTGMDGMATKKHTGDYVIDRATGAVISAELDISGSSGISAIKGHISIQRTGVE